MESLRNREIYAMRKSGKTYKVIAEHFGLTGNRVLQIVDRIDRCGFEKPRESPVAERLAKRDQEIYEMSLKGLSNSEIAAKYRTHYGTLSKERIAQIIKKKQKIEPDAADIAVDALQRIATISLGSFPVTRLRDIAKDALKRIEELEKIQRGK